MTLRGFSRAHQESVLILCAVCLLIALVGYISWAITTLTGNLAQAISIQKGDEKSATFRFEELRKLKLPGIE